jgi:YD repeat-containing protein
VSKTRYVSVGQARVIEYEYDDLYRLIEADYSSGEYFAYEYDAVGNRKTYTATITQTTVITYDYDHADRLVRVGDVDYTWDDLGRLLDDGTHQYAWDAAGRLVSVTSGADTTLFGYNGDGDRLSKSVNGTLTTYTLDIAAGLPQVLVEHSGQNATRYLHGLDLIGEQGAAWAYHLNDGLGSVRQLVDGSGQVTLAQGTRPFGGELWQAGSGQRRCCFS